MPTNDPEINQPLNPEHGVRDADSPGYETTDVNVNGVAVFLAGLFGSVLIFFVFCFVLGKVINGALEKEDGPANRWNQLSVFAGAEKTGKRQDLASNPEMQQKQLEQMVDQFPTPRLDIDDGEQSTADLHAREDLLLDHYSVSTEENGAIRIPIARAMELIAQRGQILDDDLLDGLRHCLGVAMRAAVRLLEHLIDQAQFFEPLRGAAHRVRRDFLLVGALPQDGSAARR